MSNDNKNKEIVARQLKAFSTKLNELKTFLKASRKPQKNDATECCECGSSACLWNKYDQLDDIDFGRNPVSILDTPRQSSDSSNVIFVPAEDVQNTKVYVGDQSLEIEGVTKAALEYDADLGVPVLRLEITGPRIAQ